VKQLAELFVRADWGMRMKRLSSVTPKLSFAATLACALVVGNGARAELHCEQAAVQTGDVHSGAALSHRFAVVNDGKQTIEILDVTPSCGCLTPRVDQRVFAPGARGTIRLEINTLTQAAGLQSWSVTVRYREGHEDHELALQMAATIVTEVSITPPTLVLYTSSGIGHELTLTDCRATPMNVTAVQPSSPQLRIRLGVPGIEDPCHDCQTSTPNGQRVSRYLVTHDGGERSDSVAAGFLASCRRSRCGC
jgi:hypothetical protein